ncbi:hypothetical protein [Granulicella sp. WH15]|uniref:hypothetical protein n=1 Tax=Granulicella sp. WH15 TaxID=2602070 RepID=UPI001574FFB1|nr:hypothetical protein [Granulicella sp. WH15]
MNVKWGLDSNSLFFIGQCASGVRTLFKVSLSTGHLQAITPKSHDVVNYVVAKDKVVYIAVNRNRPDQDIDASDNRLNADALAANGLPITKLLFPGAGYKPEVPELWIQSNRGNRRISRPAEDKPQQLLTDPLDAALSVSHDGHLVVRLQPVTEVPPTWDKYQPSPSTPHLRIRPDRQDEDNVLGTTLLNHYVVTDAHTGKDIIKINAPVGRHLGYFYPLESKWSEDGRFLLLTNTFLPFDSAHNGDEPQRIHPCLAAIAQISSKAVDCLRYLASPTDTTATSPPTLIDSEFDGNTVTITLKDSSKTVIRESYRYQSGTWVPASSAKSGTQSEGSGIAPLHRTPGIVAYIRQTLNDPPILKIEFKGPESKEGSWDPNPQFKDLRWGDANVIHWTDRNGHDWHGGLIKPVDYVPGKRYPIVIQMYSFHDGQFMTDGMSPTAMPARPIASAGIFFLQASRLPGHTWNQSEAQDHLEGVLSVIDKLDHEGLILPDKVGIIGFSFTAWYVENELVKAPERFAAATIADGADNSYSQYIFLDFDNPELRKQAELINGAPPFGNGINRWIQNAPAFQLDKVAAPVRIEAITPEALLAEWEIYSSLHQQRKPVDLIYYPTGQHQLQKPLERLITGQGNVDWFRYWLQGYIDPDPSKRQQYIRWAKLRDDNRPRMATGSSASQ